MLTKKQHQLLLFIDKTLKEAGVPPSFEEMKKALDLKSKSGIHRLVNGLEERGFIKRLPHRARALEVLKLPDNVGNADTLHGTDIGLEVEAVELPLYGKIAAGTPIEALRNNNEFVSVPSSMLGRGEHYALVVEGDSMMEAGILDGDTAIIKRCDTAENGSITVALVDKTEVTLKKLYRRGHTVDLRPANKDYETRTLSADRVTIQGKLSAIVRSYRH
ncbi:MAG: transcriptional repressor LexA [Alphaproteobacteria bacterium]|nr:transcriptional repressor LexA [Alphaproteobacteria bacterium]